MQVPQRSSLVAQVSDTLRQAIQAGEWKELLPTELELCARLQVSRRTMRAALAALQREGFIEIRRPKRTRIVARGRRIQVSSRPKVIGVLCWRPRASLSAFSYPLLSALETRFRTAGYEMVVHSSTGLKHRHLADRLEVLVRNTQAACWLLDSATEAIQRWFMNERIPAVLAGSAYSGVKLPAFNFDYRAICRHAAQTLARLGHRRAVLLAPKTDFAGDLNGAEGFREGWDESGSAVQARLVATHDGSVAGIQRVLDGLLESATPPTAVLVAYSMHALTVLSHLLKRRRDVPNDISLICRDDDECFAHITPSIARYRFDPDAYASRLGRAILQFAGTGTSVPRETLLFPRFHRGESLAPPRSG
jgi:DNA-binding LacI/PurR family transcriptional regulator